jgi:hypothetical protein
MLDSVLSAVRKCARDANCPFWKELKGKEGMKDGAKREEGK